MGEEEEFDQVDGGRPKLKQEKRQREGEREKEERRASPRRCLARGEALEDHRSELGSAVSVVPESFLPPVSLHCSPPQSFDIVDFDVELTAEVRLESGSSFALLSSVTPCVQTRKSGAFTHRLPSLLNHPSLSWTPRLKGHLVDTCRSPYKSPFRSPAFLQIRPCDISPTPLLNRITATGSPPGVVDAPNRTPLPSSPSTPPSSAPSSPSSSPSPSPSSSSPGGTAAGVVANGTRDPVSSTSAALLPPSLPLSPSSNPAVHSSSESPFPASDGEQESVDVYDPFHPTEGEGRPAEKEEEQDGDAGEEGEKYDPFDPTGSPDSEMMRERGIVSDRGSSPEDESRESKLIPGGMVAETEEEEEEDGRDIEGKDTPPPDFTHPPTSTRTPSPPPRQRAERERTGRKGAMVGRRHRKEANDSEIEEGEIVGAGEKARHRERERVKKRKREMGGDRAFLLPSPKVERILRVLDGDEFVSVRADSDWLASRDGDADGGSGTVALGDLRTKLLSRRRERYKSCASSSLSPPDSTLPTLSHLPPRPAPSEKRKSRKLSRNSRDRERHKQGEEKVERRRGKEGGSQERKKMDKAKDGRGRQKEGRRRRSSRSGSQKRRRSSSHSRSRASSLHGRRGQRSWSNPSEDRDREKDRVRGSGDGEREREGDSRKGRRKRERKGVNGESLSRERGSSRKRDRKCELSSRERDHDRERERRRRDGRPVMPPSIQDLNGSDLYAIKRTITVTTTNTSTTMPGSPLATRSTPPTTHDKPRKKKRKRRRQMEEEGDEEEDDRMSRSQDLFLTPPMPRSYDSDRFSEKLAAEVLSLDGEALDSDYPSLEDYPLSCPLPQPPPPQPSPKHKPKSKRGIHAKKMSQLSKTSNPSEPSLRTKPGKNSSSLSPPPSPSILPAPPLPAKQRRKAEKEREKGGKKEGGRFKSKKASGSSRKRKLQSKVSVLVREGVSSTTGVAGGVGKLGVLGGVGKELSVQAGCGSGGVVGGSIAVVFRRDNESRSPFLKPCSEPMTILGRSKDLGKMQRLGTLAPPSSSSSSQLSVLKPKKASSTTSASSSSASSPSSSSVTKQKLKQEKKGREGREKGRGGSAEEREELNHSGTWAVSGLEIQSGIAVASKSCSPPPCLPASTPSSSSTSNAVPSSPPLTPPLSLPPSQDTQQSTPDSQTVDSSCRTPETSFLSEDCLSQTQGAPSLNSPSSPPPLQALLGGPPQSIPDLKIPPDEQKGHCSRPCSSSSSSSSSSPTCSLSLSLPPSATEPSSSSVSSTSRPPPPPPPPPAAPPLPWSLQTGVDCTAGGVLALTALLFKMEEANVAGRAKAHEFIQATSQILSQANQSQSQQHPPASSSLSTSSSQVPPLPSLAPLPGQFILHGSLPLVGSTKTGLSAGSGCAQTSPAPMYMGSSGGTGGSSETGWDSESKDPEKYLKKLHTQERAVEEVKLAIKPYYQRKDIDKNEYKDILRKAVNKICHSRTGEINPVKVNNLVKLYVQRYKYFRKHGRRMDEEEREGEQTMLHFSSF